MKLDKQELVRVLRTEGDNDTADKVEGSLPDPERRLSGTGRQVRALDLTAPDQVDAEVVGTFLDHAVELGAALRAR